MKRIGQEIGEFTGCEREGEEREEENELSKHVCLQLRVLYLDHTYLYCIACGGGRSSASRPEIGPSRRVP